MAASSRAFALEVPAGSWDSRLIRREGLPLLMPRRELDAAALCVSAVNS